MRLIHTDGSQEWLKLSAYAAQLGKDDWQEVTKPSVQGGQKWNVPSPAHPLRLVGQA